MRETEYIEMIEIKPGSFLRGSDSPEAMEYEKPVHLVEVASFWIATAPVT
jgi:formylglycine-generating enzyme required for sulfatase activity